MGRSEHAIPRDGLAVVEAHLGWDLAGRQIDALSVGPPQETLGEAAPGRRIALVRTAERLDDPGVRTSPLRVEESWSASGR